MSHRGDIHDGVAGVGSNLPRADHRRSDLVRSAPDCCALAAAPRPNFSETRDANLLGDPLRKWILRLRHQGSSMSSRRPPHAPFHVPSSCSGYIGDEMRREPAALAPASYGWTPFV